MVVMSISFCSDCTVFCPQIRYGIFIEAPVDISDVEIWGMYLVATNIYSNYEDMLIIHRTVH